MGNGMILVEGEGEEQAAPELISRLWKDLGLSPIPWQNTWRCPASHKRPALMEACDRLRMRNRFAKARDMVEALLVLRDADDDCPKSLGPEMAGWLRSERLPFPSAVVLFHREFETLFLPCLSRMAGKTWMNARGVERGGFPPQISFEGDLEGTRGVKEWLSTQLPKGKSYKPTQDQFPLTRMLDFDDLRQSGLPSFGTLERALRFLDGARGRSEVYPPPTS